MRILPFKPEHLVVMTMRDWEKEKVYPYVAQGWLDQCSRLPHNATLVYDGRIITCIGLIPLWEGVYEVWQIPSVYVETYKIWYVKTLWQLFEKKAELLKFHRLQTKCPADDLHDRWMKAMSFECEGILRNYNIFKDDFKMWSRIWQR